METMGTGTETRWCFGMLRAATNQLSDISKHTQPGSVLDASREMLSLHLANSQ